MTSDVVFVQSRVSEATSDALRRVWLAFLTSPAALYAALSVSRKPAFRDSDRFDSSLGKFHCASRIDSLLRIVNQEIREIVQRVCGGWVGSSAPARDAEWPERTDRADRNVRQ